MSEDERDPAARRLSGGPAGDLAGDLAGDPPPHEIPRAPEETLPPELSALEAELAQLRPRADGLDRLRLAFLAGRESVGAPTSHRAGRWAWPAAFAAMTAVAATLLAMLLLASQRPGEIRLVQVPVYLPALEAVGDSPDVRRGQKGTVPFEIPDRAMRRERSPSPVVRGLAALVGLDWPGGEEEADLTAALSYVSLVDRVLEKGVDALPSPPPAVASESASEPMSYQRLREDLLGRPSPETPYLGPPPADSSSFPGANS